MRASVVAREQAGEPGGQDPRLVEERVRRVDDQETGARQGALSVDADRAGPTSSSIRRMFGAPRAATLLRKCASAAGSRIGRQAR